MKKVYFLISLLLLAIGLAGCGNEPGKEIRFGTGGTGGTYYAYGSALAKLIQEDAKGQVLDVKATAGSSANLRLLRDGFLDLAIVQSDTLSDAVNGSGIFVSTGPASGYAAVAGLYTEACHIVVPKGSDIQNVRDLAGKRVSVGEKESGVLKNAEEILLAHGLTTKMLQPSYLSFADSADAMTRGEVDAFFCTAGAPIPAISKLASQMEIRLIPIEPEVLDNVMKLYNGYTRCTIPAGTYQGQDADIPTLGVKAVLVANTALSNDTVAYITEFLLKNSGKLRSATKAATDIDPSYATTDIPGAFHAGASRYYESQGIHVETYSGAAGKRLMAGQD